MNQEKLLMLIQASQDCLKHELIPKHSESKYELLMLLRSFDLLKQYITHAAQQDQSIQATLHEIYGVPITNIEEGLQHLSQDLRQDYQIDWYNYLVKLNRAELAITHPEELKHG